MLEISESEEERDAEVKTSQAELKHDWSSGTKKKEKMMIKIKDESQVKTRRDKESKGRNQDTKCVVFCCSGE